MARYSKQYKNKMSKIATVRLAATMIAVLVVASLLAGGLMVTAPAVSAQTDPAPAAYYGSVTVDGEPAPAGVEVTAELAGGTYGPIETDSDGDFGGPTGADERLEVSPEAPPENKLVTFYVNGQQAEETVTWEPFGGDDGPVELSVDELPEEPDEPDSDDEGDADSQDGGQAGGGQGGGGQAGGADSTAESGPPTVSQVKDTLQLADPTAETEVDISDSDTEADGVSISLDESEAVKGINFESESVSGSIETTEYTEVPERVSEEVSTSVGDEIESVEYDSTSGTTDREIEVHTVADISPTTDEAEETTATVELTVDAGTVEDPSQLTVVKEHYSFAAQTDRWKELETTVTERDANEITVEATVDEFSLFAITEIESRTNTAETAADDAGETDGTDSTVPGFGIAAVVSAVLTVAALSARRGQ